MKSILILILTISCGLCARAESRKLNAAELVNIKKAILSQVGGAMKCPLNQWYAILPRDIVQNAKVAFKIEEGSKEMTISFEEIDLTSEEDAIKMFDREQRNSLVVKIEQISQKVTVEKLDVYDLPKNMNANVGESIRSSYTLTRTLSCGF